MAIADCSREHHGVHHVSFGLPCALILQGSGVSYEFGAIFELPHSFADYDSHLWPWR